MRRRIPLAGGTKGRPPSVWRPRPAVAAAAAATLVAGLVAAPTPAVASVGWTSSGSVVDVDLSRPDVGVRIDLTGAGETVEVVRNGHPLRAGGGVSVGRGGVLVDRLPESGLARYGVVAEDPRGRYPVAKLLVPARESLAAPEGEPYPLAPAVGYAAEPGRVQLFWQPLPVSVYRVYRDDRLLGVTGTPEFVDTTITPGTDYSYVVRAEIEPSGRPGDLGRHYDTGVELTTLPARSDEAGTAEAVSRMTGPAAVAAAAYDPTHNTIRLKAFIAADWVPAFPCDIRPNHFFKGDNRSWNAGGGTARLRADWVLEWGAGGVARFSKGIGTTTKWRKQSDGTFVQVDSAVTSAAGITGESRKVSAEHYRIQTSVSASNPLCFTGNFAAINARIEPGSVIYGGGYSLRGFVEQYPSFEIYNIDTNGRVHTIFQSRENVGVCLVDLCPDVNWQRSR